MKLWLWRIGPLFLFVCLAMVMWRGLYNDPRALPSVLEGKKLPKISAPILFSKNDDHQLPSKHWFILTVWGSWCEACIDEQAFLMKLQRQGVLLYGLNYKDSKENAKKWLQTWGNPYSLIWQDINGSVAINLGVYGAPESFLVDRNGFITHRHAGGLDEKVWQQEFLPRINAYDA